MWLFYLHLLTYWPYNHSQQPGLTAWLAAAAAAAAASRICKGFTSDLEGLRLIASWYLRDQVEKRTATESESGRGCRWRHCRQKERKKMSDSRAHIFFLIVDNCLAGKTTYAQRIQNEQPKWIDRRLVQRQYACALPSVFFSIAIHHLWLAI